MKTINAKAKDLKATHQALQNAVNGQPVLVKNAAELHGFAAGFQHGQIIVEGDIGDYVAVLNAGASVRVTGKAGRYAGDNMTAGTLVIEGSADYGVGQYCYGGTVVVHGDAGDFTATMNKGATILVDGNVGNEVGTYMLKGDLIVVGNAGENFANYLIRGNVYIGGEWKSLGHNTRVELLETTDVEKLQMLFRENGIKANPAGFKKIVAASPKPFYN